MENDIKEEEQALEGGAYEVLKKRISGLESELSEKLEQINEKRKAIYGGHQSKVVGNERIQTENNCIPRDITGIGEYLLFGYNVFIGLRDETKVNDVFSVLKFDGNSFVEANVDVFADDNFTKDFNELYRYYKNVKFLQFIKSASRLMFIFQCGETIDDRKILNFNIENDNSLKYLDNRGEMEYKLPPQHDFEWNELKREHQSSGEFPNYCIEDKLFVNCMGGSITIKIEDNTTSGEGIYSEAVENADQTLDDSSNFYAVVGDLIIWKVKPYREQNYRYFVFNHKKESAVRIDSIERACVQLPEDHGIIFPRGYYLQDGDMRLFDEDVADMKYLECIPSPNGEDYLFIFYHEKMGLHILLQYNLITKGLANPISCHGYSLYEDGKMVVFNTQDEEPKRNHPMQIWDTPFFSETYEVIPDSDSYLTKIGNRDLVKGISEGYSISRLMSSQEASLYTYQDIIKASTSIVNNYHWLGHEEFFGTKELVGEIKSAACAAVAEYEKVVEIRKNTKHQFNETEVAVKKCLLDASPDSMTSITQFVDSLGEIRTRRGQVISLRELRYIDLSLVDSLDVKLSEASDLVANACVEFLLDPTALEPYIRENDEILHNLKTVQKIADIIPLDESLEKLAENLDLLTDVVNNLKIDDATKTTQIVDGITDVYAALNRTRASLKNQKKELGSAEAKAEFSAQFKLISQSITNYIGMCDTILKCDEYLTKLMITIEELEGKFAEYDEFVEQLIEKREEAYSAFSSRKQVLDEEQKRRVTSLLSSAERILKGVTNRAESFKDVDEVNSYFASDLMVSKYRDIIIKLEKLGDTVKSDDLIGRLKSAKGDIIRKLRDKLDLFEDGTDIISFGDYKFTVNTQALDLTTIFRDGDMYYHLTGSDFYEKIEDEEFLKTRELWEQELISEDKTVYRAEYLVYQMLMDATVNAKDLSIQILTEATKDSDKMLELVKNYASNLYNEGYDKGIHDHDAVLILNKVIALYNECALLRYDSLSRAHAILFWRFYEDTEYRDTLRNKLRSYGAMSRIFDYTDLRDDYVSELKELIKTFFKNIDREVAPAVLSNAAEYLYFELQDQVVLEFTINSLAHELSKRFMNHIKLKKVYDEFIKDIDDISDVKSKINLIYDWVSTFVSSKEKADSEYLIWEVVALIAGKDCINQDVASISTFVEVKGLVGQHRLIEKKVLPIYFDRFLLKMKHFTEVQVPLFKKFIKLRGELTASCKEEMRLSEFKPKVMGAFVRNKLINDVYLNLVGANFAKQMGAAGDNKRTDLMGLLLLISPPGYGKTTLMEYIAHRLGLTFMKINGPAIGHNVTSLDPAEAPNATAREELQKMNLSLEMGNNVMIYLDDIQHLNPEFLQKFISLCDAQRKIEGVYKGKTKTYDFRGKKVSVVMAGNPYTESGDKFQIPDMLSNRADTYNLGDISSTAADVFAMSFIENAMTSNGVLNSISSHGHADIYKFMDIASRGTGEGIEFDYNYSSAEIDEIVTVLKKLYLVRDTILRVNQEYIASAAKQEEYRTEPAFKMQGSYRNMCRMAEKVFPVMTDEEVNNIILDHYYNEAQTLTTGAESNILKFKDMMGILSEDEASRWTTIKTEFNRRQSLMGEDDDIGKILTQLSHFNTGIKGVQAAVENSSINIDLSPLQESLKQIADKGIDIQPIVKALQEMSKNNNVNIETTIHKEAINEVEVIKK